MNAGEAELVCRYFKTEFLRKETPLVLAGSKYKKVVFVADGILRVYIVDKNGEEIVKNFIEPNSFFVEMESFDKNQNALINVCAVTDCTLLTLTKADAERLGKDLPAWEYILKTGTMQAMIEMVRRQEFLYSGDSKEQYLHFMKNFPLLVKHVPLKYIASYLRITQSSLSRIRRQME